MTQYSKRMVIVHWLALALVVAASQTWGRAELKLASPEGAVASSPASGR